MQPPTKDPTECYEPVGGLLAPERNHQPVPDGCRVRPPPPLHQLCFPPPAGHRILRNVPSPISNLQSLLSTLAPVRHPGVFVYAVVPSLQRLGAIVPVAMMTEPEGLSVILPEADAAALGLEPHFRCAWITLTVHSDLAAHGLTAAFSTALAEARISCNVIAGVYHDHLLVPDAQADEAMAVLLALQARATAELV